MRGHRLIRRAANLGRPALPRPPRRPASVRALSEALSAHAAAWLLVLAAPLAMAQGEPAAAAQGEPPGQGAPLWLDARGHPLPAARTALHWLESAHQQGLDPQDYDSAALAQALQQAEIQPLAPEPGHQLDAALTQQVLRYLHALRHGRVDPARLRAHYDSPAAPAPDLRAALHTAVVEGRPDAALHAALPPWPQYQALQQALVHYQRLEAEPAWHSPLPALPGGRLVAGQRWAGLATLAARLHALGDLPEPAPAPVNYDATLQRAVRAFQTRHALAADGVVGKPTLEALNVAPAARARQIALAMERLRLTPLPEAARFITVNVPEFMLRAYDHRGAPPQQAMAMRVIVGKALDTRTPLFDADLQWIEFSPYWNIPPSIARSETVPKLRANPGYLASQGMEFVGPGGQVSTAVTPELLDAVLAGQWRIRQRPGPRNALGDVKFVMPNNQAIYLHHTPSVGLFNRLRRDFSHGCVRVEEPVALAEWLLQDEPAWTAARIRDAMAKPKPVTARLSGAVPVLMLYQTAVAEADGVHFVPDVYGQDALLAQALRQASRPPSPAAAPQARVQRRAGTSEFVAAQ